MPAAAAVEGAAEGLSELRLGWEMRNVCASACLALAMLAGGVAHAQTAASAEDVKRLGPAFFKEYSDWMSAVDRADAATMTLTPSESPKDRSERLDKLWDDSDREAVEAFDLLKVIAGRHGWVDGGTWGRPVEQAAIVIVATRLIGLKKDDASREAVAFAKTTLPQMREAVLMRGGSAKSYAQIVDDIELFEERLQVYGSNFNCVGSRFAPYSVLDPERLNERRASIGLDPIEKHRYSLNASMQEFCAEHPGPVR